MDTKNMKPESIAAQALGWIDEATRAISPPIHTATTYLRDEDNQYRSGRVYSRDQNPSYDQAEAVLTALEGGHQTLLFASGMAAATAVFQALAPGDHVVAPKVMYWSLRNWLMNFATHWGLVVDFIEMDSLTALQEAVRPGKTKLGGSKRRPPLWTITDIEAACRIAHQAGALVAVDSTVGTPVLSQPLKLGADIVMHAATKYLNGHSDVIAGSLTVREDSPTWQRIRAVRAQIGGVLGPFEAWLLTRGMLSIRVKGKGGAGEAAAIATAASVRLWKRATSLGGVESLVEHRASIEGAGTPVPPDLLRLSVGIEDTGDLIADLEAALTLAHA